MALTGIATPSLARCDIAGGAIARAGQAADALAPAWAAGTWVTGKIVLDQGTVYIATADHTSTDAAPSTGAAGWLALSAKPTQVPVWVQGDAYPVNSPVRIDYANNLSKVFMATRAVAASMDSPDSIAGKAAGWTEIGVEAPPPASPWSATVTYRLGDLCQEPLGTLWVSTQPIPAGSSRPAVFGSGWQKVGP